jgi:hypothetical protein
MNEKFSKILEMSNVKLVNDNYILDKETMNILLNTVVQECIISITKDDVYYDKFGNYGWTTGKRDAIERVKKYFG